MATWEWGLDAIGVLLVLVVCYFVALMVRRRVIARHGGTFELSHRVRAARPGRGWALGVGRYSGETLEWFRVFSLSPRPRGRWVRAGMVYDSSRSPEGPEAAALYPGHVIVACHFEGALLELAMDATALTGFQAWLESRPPGTDWSR